MPSDGGNYQGRSPGIAATLRPVEINPIVWLLIGFASAILLNRDHKEPLDDGLRVAMETTMSMLGLGMLVAMGALLASSVALVVSIAVFHIDTPSITGDGPLLAFVLLLVTGLEVQLTRESNRRP